MISFRIAQRRLNICRLEIFLMFRYNRKGQRKLNAIWSIREVWTMRLLSDTIEQFIKALMEDENREIELRRNELADHFQCAPSQINYVLATRFTPDHGYVIESRRGGGGYIRIVRLAATSREELLQTLYQRIGTSISMSDASKIIEHLKAESIVTPDEAQLMLAALSPQAVPLPLSMKDALCAGTLRSMILSLAKRKCEL